MTISAAKHQHSDKSLKIKLKALKNSIRAPPARMLLHFLVCPKLPSPLEKKNKEKLLQSNENDLGAKRVKLQKYEAIKKALKKGLLILRRENVLDPSLNIEATY